MFPFIIIPSTGILSPGFTITISSISTWSMFISISFPFFLMVALSGLNFIKLLIDFFDLSIDKSSMNSAMKNNNINMDPSNPSPIKMLLLLQLLLVILFLFLCLVMILFHVL